MKLKSGSNPTQLSAMLGSELVTNGLATPPACTSWPAKLLWPTSHYSSWLILLVLASLVEYARAWSNMLELVDRLACQPASQLSKRTELNARQLELANKTD